MVDPVVMIDVMNVSTARCFNTEMVMRQQVISGQFASGFATVRCPRQRDASLVSTSNGAYCRGQFVPV